MKLFICWSHWILIRCLLVGHSCARHYIHATIYTCVCMCVHACGCERACLYVCVSMNVYMCVSMNVCMCVNMQVCMCVSMHVCEYACLYVCEYACVRVCMFVCVWVCMFVCVWVCMSVCVHVMYRRDSMFEHTHPKLASSRWAGPSIYGCVNSIQSWQSCRDSSSTAYSAAIRACSVFPLLCH